jgi:lipopolysaccharide/colanic/teichoic acid biosynthesis glycosyltransferase
MGEMGASAPAPAQRRVGEGLSATAATKRAVDVVGAVVLLVLTAPLLLLAVVATGLTSRGPVLFRQTRLGRDTEPFVLLKVRTMRWGSGDQAHRDYVTRLLSGTVVAEDGLYKLAHDRRVTRVGAVLRRTSLDELPQLWNVLRGEMSLVGPRPALEWEAELFPGWARRRFEVRPGLSGLWQVSGRNRLTMTEGLLLDVRYVEELSLARDLLILLRTVRAVLLPGAR